MFACCRLAASLISRVKRSAETPAARSGCSTFTITSRSSAASRAGKTRLMPPPPSSRVSVYAIPSVSCSRSWRESVGTAAGEGKDALGDNIRAGAS